jgi:hypothetical protein
MEIKNKMETKTLKHTWKKDLPFPVEVKIHVDVEKKEYWMELNGCQETARMDIPNIEGNNGLQYVEDIEKHPIKKIEALTMDMANLELKDLQKGEEE